MGEPVGFWQARSSGRRRRAVLQALEGEGRLDAALPAALRVAGWRATSWQDVAERLWGRALPTWCVLAPPVDLRRQRPHKRHRIAEPLRVQAHIGWSVSSGWGRKHKAVDLKEARPAATAPRRRRRLEGRSTAPEAPPDATALPPSAAVLCSYAICRAAPPQNATGGRPTTLRLFKPLQPCNAISCLLFKPTRGVRRAPRCLKIMARQWPQQGSSNRCQSTRAPSSCPANTLEGGDWLRQGRFSAGGSGQTSYLTPNLAGLTGTGTQT